MTGRSMRWWVIATVVLGALIACRQLARPTLDKAGGFLWEMTEINTAYRDSLYHRGVAHDQRAANARDVARRLVEQRHRLAAHLPDLDAGSEFAVRLRRFVEAWPSEEAFLSDLLDEGPRGNRCGIEITGLAMLAPDTRPRWSTPFKIFRP